jgi:hypothetical protein
MSYNKTKTDPELGQRVHEHLVKMGVETPTNNTNIDRKEKIDIIERHMHQIMVTLGLDLNDDSLIETPKRVAKMYVNEIFWGLDYEAFPKCTTVDNKMKWSLNATSMSKVIVSITLLLLTVWLLSHTYQKIKSWAYLKSIELSSIFQSVRKSKND